MQACCYYSGKSLRVGEKERCSQGLYQEIQPGPCCRIPRCSSFPPGLPAFFLEEQEVCRPPLASFSWQMLA
jgi:hypothetical protein